MDQLQGVQRIVMCCNTRFFFRGRLISLAAFLFTYFFLFNYDYIYLFFLRQLATATPGVPLFEVFFTVNDKGEYKQQVNTKLC